MQLKYNLTYKDNAFSYFFYHSHNFFLIYQLVRILLCISTLTFYSGNHCYVNILYKKIICVQPNAETICFDIP